MSTTPSLAPHCEANLDAPFVKAFLKKDPNGIFVCVLTCVSTAQLSPILGSSGVGTVTHTVSVCTYIPHTADAATPMPNSQYHSFCRVVLHLQRYLPSKEERSTVIIASRRLRLQAKKQYSSFSEKIVFWENSLINLGSLYLVPFWSRNYMIDIITSSIR